MKLTKYKGLNNQRLALKMKKNTMLVSGNKGTRMKM